MWTLSMIYLSRYLISDKWTKPTFEVILNAADATISDVCTILYLYNKDEAIFCQMPNNRLRSTHYMYLCVCTLQHWCVFSQPIFDISTGRRKNNSQCQGILQDVGKSYLKNNFPLLIDHNSTKNILKQ